jgi:hypothetical protein
VVVLAMTCVGRDRLFLSSVHQGLAVAFFAAHNTPVPVFITFMSAARRPWPPLDGAAAEGGPRCVLQQLSAHGPHHAICFMKRIAAFAGVPMASTPLASHFKAIVSLCRQAPF